MDGDCRAPQRQWISRSPRPCAAPHTSPFLIRARPPTWLPPSRQNTTRCNSSKSTTSLDVVRCCFRRSPLRPRPLRTAQHNKTQAPSVRVRAVNAFQINRPIDPPIHQSSIINPLAKTILRTDRHLDPVMLGYTQPEPLLLLNAAPRAREASETFTGRHGGAMHAHT